MTKLCWSPITDGDINAKELYMPAKRRKPIDLLIHFDLFAQTHQVIDVVLAVVASSGSTRFFYETAVPAKRKAYFTNLKKRSKAAAKDYESRMKAHFQKYKYEFVAGYSLPEAPTPELRAIYDSAAGWEKRPTEPCGTTLRSGWSLGEYHWRKWPLSNLIDENDLSIAK